MFSFAPLKVEDGWVLWKLLVLLSLLLDCCRRDRPALPLALLVVPVVLGGGAAAAAGAVAGGVADILRW
jgi:hypothetical protein